VSAAPSNQRADGDIAISCYKAASLVLYSFAIDTSNMESEAFEDIEKGGGALRTIKDLAAGAAGGMAQVLLGMCAP
jgi:hypothetical protein